MVDVHATRTGRDPMPGSHTSRGSAAGDFAAAVPVLFVLVDPEEPSDADPRGTVFLVAVTRAVLGPSGVASVDVASAEWLRGEGYLEAADRVDALKRRGSAPVVEVVPAEVADLTAMVNVWHWPGGGAGTLEPGWDGQRLPAGVVGLYHRLVDAPTVRLPDVELVAVVRRGPGQGADFRFLSELAQRPPCAVGESVRAHMPAGAQPVGPLYWVEVEDLLHPAAGLWVVEVRRVRIERPPARNWDWARVVRVDDDEYTLALRRHLLGAFVVAPDDGPMLPGRTRGRFFGPGVTV